MKVGVRRKETLCRLKWSVGVNYISGGLRCILPHSHVGDSI